MVPQIHPNPKNNDFKRHQKNDLFLDRLFDHVGFVLVPKFRQLGRQWRHLGPQDPPRSPKMSCGNRPFSCLGAKRPAGPPQDLSKRSQDSPKTPPKRDPRRLKRLQDGPQRDIPQEASRWLQEAPRGPQDVPKTAQDGPESPPRRPETAQTKSHRTGPNLSSGRTKHRKTDLD